MINKNADQNTVYIPFAGDEDGEDHSHSLPELEGSPPQEREIRFEAYRQAWAKCLERLQAITRALLDPLASQIVEEIEDTSVLPGLPRHELPVITVTNPMFRGTFLYDITQRLDNPCVHLYPSDCPNVISGMRAIVSGLIETNDDTGRAKHRPTNSLANYDIQLLAAWYRHYRSTNEDQTQLLVVLHDFEAFAPSVMQDIFYICSRQLPDLPLVFILSLLSPVPSYLNIAYPRSTLARLRIRRVTLPGGVSVLNDIITQLCFSVDFQPDVILGPIALQFISDFFMRHDSTLDSLITNLQLVYMKHFSVEPLTALLYSTPSEDELILPEWANVVDGLLIRLTPASKKLAPAERDQQWKSLTPSKVRELVQTHGSSFYSRAKGVVIAFNLMKIIQEFLVEEGFKGLGWDFKAGLCDILVEFMQNNVGRDVKDLSLIMRKMNVTQLEKLLPRIQEFLSRLQSNLAPDLLKVETLIESLESEASSNVPQQFSEWGSSFFKKNLVSLEENPLWEIWYTGLSPFPLELVNPSIRASMIAGLLRPLDFVEGDGSEEDLHAEDALWKMPDTTILFKRYLDSGKMINVYDWFESFQAVLENQKEELNKAKVPSPKKSNSPRKPSAKAKGKAKQQDQDQETMDVEQSEEEWKLEVQARFMRALHELDYLGFIKHTKRKADHVLRTVFDLNE